MSLSNEQIKDSKHYYVVTKYMQQPFIYIPSPDNMIGVMGVLKEFNTKKGQTGTNTVQPKKTLNAFCKTDDDNVHRNVSNL